MSLFRKILLGIVVLIGVFLLIGGVYGTIVNLYEYLVEHDLYIVGLLLSPILAVVGVGFTYVGTKYLDRAKTFLENSWLIGAAMLGLGLFAFIFDAVTDRLTCDFSGLILEITLVVMGCLFVCASMRKTRRKIKTGN